MHIAGFQDYQYSLAMLKKKGKDVVKDECVMLRMRSGGYWKKITLKKGDKISLSNLSYLKDHYTPGV